MIVLAKFVHLQLLVKNNDIAHLEKADSLIIDAINRLKKYPEVPRATVYLKDMNQFVEMNNVYDEYFGASKPARAAVEVCRLPKDVMVEIDAIAVK